MSIALPLGVMDVLIYIAIVLVPVVVIVRYSTKRSKLPPGPPAWPIFGNAMKLLLTSKAFEDFIKSCREKYGPIFTIMFGRTPFVIITDRKIAYDTLVKQSLKSSDRPVPGGFRKFFSCSGHNITSSQYGPLWKSLRGALASGVLAKAAAGHFKDLREWAMERMCEEIITEAGKNDGVVQPREHFRRVIYRMMLGLCFGVQPSDETVAGFVRVIGEFQRSGLILNDSPITPFIPSRRALARRLRKLQLDLMLPLVKAARSNSNNGYINDLIALRVHEDQRPLSDYELVTLCSEFMTAGTDTSVTTLEWGFANIVREERIQERLYSEISELGVSQENLRNMSYLQAFVKETLRKHPPAHFLLTHAVSEDTEISGYTVPRGSRLNVYLYGIGMNEEKFRAPDDFRPERYMPKPEGDGIETDYFGSKEIVMMPFGAGRRICPGINVSVHHLSFIISRLVQRFHMLPETDEGVDMSESMVLTMVMNKPLRTRISERV